MKPNPRDFFSSSTITFTSDIDPATTNYSFITCVPPALFPTIPPNLLPPFPLIFFHSPYFFFPFANLSHFQSPFLLSIIRLSPSISPPPLFSIHPLPFSLHPLPFSLHLAPPFLLSSSHFRHFSPLSISRALTKTTKGTLHVIFGCGDG